MAVTGAPDYLIKKALAELKNPKYAHKTGALAIVKNPGSNLYYVTNQPATPQAITTPTELKQAAQPKVPPKTFPGGEKVDSDTADKVYKTKLADASAQLMDTTVLTSEWNTKTQSAMLTFKQERANAMAEWKANVSGLEIKAVPQQLYHADKLLWENLAAGNDWQEAFSQWKGDTAKEKTGNLEGSPNYKKPAEVQPAPKATVTAHTSPLPELKGKNVLSSGYKQVNGKMFDGTEFKKGFSATNTTFASSLSPGDAKKAVETALHGRLQSSKAYLAVSAEYEARTKQTLARRFVSNWASSSGGHCAESNAMQLAIADAFGMSTEHVEKSALKVLGEHGEDGVFKQAAKDIQFKGDPAVLKEAMRDFAKAQYDHTQAELKHRGVTDVYLARGMNVGGYSDNAKLVELKLQPASSFSTSYKTASGFGHHGSLFLVKVPASSVLGSFNTGFGCLNEKEVVVLASPGMRAVQLGKSKASGITEAVTHVKNQVKGW